MPIIHENTAQQFHFITDNQFIAGKLAYRYLSDNHIDVFSTRVDNAFQGQGIAGELYNALIEFAVQQQLKITPSCSYIATKMARSHPELRA